ncbi:MAG: glycosyltransferase family 4 protein [Pseudomonadota bacterium]
MNRASEPAIWLPAVRAGSGADVFTERLVDGLNRRGLRAEIAWLPHRAEYAPWAVSVPHPPAWANIAHINSWLHPRFIPGGLPIVASMFHCVLDPALSPYKTHLQRLYHRFWVKPLEQKVLARAGQVIAISQYTKERTEEIYGISGIQKILCGIDLACFQPTPSKSCHSPFRLLFVGNWSRRKGADLLLPIMRMLGKDFELWLLAGLRASQLSDLAPNIRLLPPCADDTAMVTLYQECDVLLFPSRLEGFGLAVLEAQSCGLPVIVTHGSALPEIVEQGVTGFLCPQDDVSAFAAACQHLSADPLLWRRMGEAARTRAVAHFGIETMIDRYVAVYRSVLEQP